MLRKDGSRALVTAVAPDADALRTLAGRVNADGEPVRATIDSMNGARLVHDSLEFSGWDVRIAAAQRVRGLAPLAAKTDTIDARGARRAHPTSLGPRDHRYRTPEVRQERERASGSKYQVAGRLEEAVGLIQQLHGAEPDDPVVRLSLTDLLDAEGDFEGAVEVAAPAQNSGDVDLATIHLRAKALLELDQRIAAFETYRLALARTAGRSLELLKAIRYDRALAYEETGQSTKAQADFERIYALDPTYRVVKARLDAIAPPRSSA